MSEETFDLSDPTRSLGESPSPYELNDEVEITDPPGRGTIVGGHGRRTPDGQVDARYMVKRTDGDVSEEPISNLRKLWASG
jgi:hypothetical protein